MPRIQIGIPVGQGRVIRGPSPHHQNTNNQLLHELGVLKQQLLTERQERANRQKLLMESKQMLERERDLMIRMQSLEQEKKSNDNLILELRAQVNRRAQSPRTGSDN